MKSLFKEYYKPSEEEIAGIWKQCIFAFDTNVLLNLYRFRMEGQNQLLQILEKLADRVWLPNQVAFEFHRNRLEVITEQFDVYTKIKTLVNNTRNDFSKNFTRHPIIDLEKIEEVLNSTISKTSEILEGAEGHHPELLSDDSLLTKISNVFEGRTGAEYPEQTLITKLKTATERCLKEIPPGYKDFNNPKKTTELRKCGDAIIWFQLLDYAKTIKVPLVFVTDDAKEDWWLEHKGKTIGPRPELIKEMRVTSDAAFYLYSSSQFIKYAADFLGLATEKAFREAEEIQKEDKFIEDQNNEKAQSLTYFDLGIEKGIIGQEIGSFFSDLGVTFYNARFADAQGIFNPSKIAIKTFENHDPRNLFPLTLMFDDPVTYFSCLVADLSGYGSNMQFFDKNRRPIGGSEILSRFGEVQIPPRVIRFKRTNEYRLAKWVEFSQPENTNIEKGLVLINNITFGRID